MVYAGFNKSFTYIIHAIYIMVMFKSFQQFFSFISVSKRKRCPAEFLVFFRRCFSLPLHVGRAMYFAFFFLFVLRSITFYGHQYLTERDFRPRYRYKRNESSANGCYVSVYKRNVRKPKLTEFDRCFGFLTRVRVLSTQRQQRRNP